MGLDVGTLSSLRGTIAYSTGKILNALSGGVLKVTGASPTMTVGTMECWLKHTNSGTKVAVGNDTTGVWLGYSGGKIGFFTNAYNIQSLAGNNDGSWHHAAVTYDGTNVKLWVDGVLQGTVAGTNPFTSSSDTTAIGGYGATSSFDFTSGGMIDEVRWSDTVRYTGTFTPQTTEFTSDSNTIKLFHLDNVDLTPPSVPTGLAATGGPAQVTLSWTASTDDTAVASYKVRRGGTLIATVTTTRYTDLGLAAGSYTYTVSAVDSVGNESAASSSVTASAVAGVLIAPNAANLAYSPYTWDLTSARAMTINPGAYLRFAVDSTTALVLNFDIDANDTPLPQIKARVDGGPWTTYTIAASVPLTIPSDNAWTTHFVELVVKATSEFVTRWTPQNAAVKLTGIAAAGASAATRAVVRSDLNALVFADSIGEGYKALSNTTDVAGSDAEVVWAHMLQQLLGAEVGVVAFGGQSWLAAGQGGVPALPAAYNLLWGGGPSRSLASPIPDLIVINMGENDNTANIVSAVTSFLNAILAATPTSTHIAVMRPFSGREAANLQAGIAACNDPSRVYYIDTTGWWSSADSADGQHPYGYASQAALGPKLANALRNVGAFGGSSSGHYVNVGGVATAVGAVVKV